MAHPRSNGDEQATSKQPGAVTDLNAETKTQTTNHPTAQPVLSHPTTNNNPSPQDIRDTSLSPPPLPRKPISLTRTTQQPTASEQVTVMVAFRNCAVALALAASAVSAQVSVPLTIPVTVPFTVPAGQSFDVAATKFCERNGLSTDQAPMLSAALEQEWARNQARNRATRCFKWQRRYSVAPLKSWGSMPDETRIQWLELQCDNVVPMEPPVPVVSVSVRLHDSDIALDYFEGENVDEVVAEFCTNNNIDYEAHGATLRQALIDRAATMAEEAKAAKEAQAIQQQQQQQQQPQAAEAGLAKEQEEKLKSVAPARGAFLFAVPVSINGNTVNLNVHEGDALGPLVNNFCTENKVPIDQYGDMLKKSVLDALEGLQRALLQELEKQAAPQAAAPVAAEPAATPTSGSRVKVLSVPINIDGKLVDMDLFEGDELAASVSQFCGAHGIKEEDYGQALRTVVLERYKLYQQENARMAA